jgi:hypothetical protein
LLGDSEIESILKRLDRLTQEEARMTVAQTLAVVHSLLDNMKVVMVGESSCFSEHKTTIQTVVDVGGEASTKAIRRTLSTFCHYVRISVPGLTDVASYHAGGRQ